MSKLDYSICICIPLCICKKFCICICMQSLYLYLYLYEEFYGAMSETTKHAGTFHLYPNLIKAETDRGLYYTLLLLRSISLLYFVYLYKYFSPVLFPTFLPIIAKMIENKACNAHVFFFMQQIHYNEAFVTSQCNFPELHCIEEHTLGYLELHWTTMRCTHWVTLRYTTLKDRLNYIKIHCI